MQRPWKRIVDATVATSYINYTYVYKRATRKSRSVVVQRLNASSSSILLRFSIRLAPSAESACKLINDRSRPPRDEKRRRERENRRWSLLSLARFLLRTGHVRAEKYRSSTKSRSCFVARFVLNSPSFAECFLNRDFLFVVSQEDLARFYPHNYSSSFFFCCFSCYLPFVCLVYS